jgi:hypothetical protein
MRDWTEGKSDLSSSFSGIYDLFTCLIEAAEQPDKEAR